MFDNAARRTDPALVWTSATFALDAEGAFSIDDGYDPIEDEDDRAAAWKIKYLPHD